MINVENETNGNCTSTIAQRRNCCGPQTRLKITLPVAEVDFPQLPYDPFEQGMHTNGQISLSGTASAHLLSKSAMEVSSSSLFGGVAPQTTPERKRSANHVPTKIVNYSPYSQHSIIPSFSPTTPSKTFYFRSPPANSQQKKLQEDCEDVYDSTANIMDRISYIMLTGQPAPTSLSENAVSIANRKDPTQIKIQSSGTSSYCKGSGGGIAKRNGRKSKQQRRQFLTRKKREEVVYKGKEGQDHGEGKHVQWKLDFKTGYPEEVQSNMAGNEHIVHTSKGKCCAVGEFHSDYRDRKKHDEAVSERSNKIAASSNAATITKVVKEKCSNPPPSGISQTKLSVVNVVVYQNQKSNCTQVFPSTHGISTVRITPPDAIQQRVLLSGAVISKPMRSPQQMLQMHFNNKHHSQNTKKTSQQRPHSAPHCRSPSVVVPNSSHPVAEQDVSDQNRTSCKEKPAALQLNSNGVDSFSLSMMPFTTTTTTTIIKSQDRDCSTPENCSSLHVSHNLGNGINWFDKNEECVHKRRVRVSVNGKLRRPVSAGYDRAKQKYRKPKLCSSDISALEITAGGYVVKPPTVWESNHPKKCAQEEQTYDKNGGGRRRGKNSTQRESHPSENRPQQQQLTQVGNSNKCMRGNHSGVNRVLPVSRMAELLINRKQKSVLASKRNKSKESSKPWKQIIKPSEPRPSRSIHRPQSAFSYNTSKSAWKGTEKDMRLKNAPKKSATKTSTSNGPINSICINGVGLIATERVA